MRAIPNRSRLRYIAHNPTSRLLSILVNRTKAIIRLIKMK